MWQGTLIFTKGHGSMAELLNAGVSILESKKVKHKGRILGWKILVRFTTETMDKIKKLDNTYTWTGRWLEKKSRDLRVV